MSARPDLGFVIAYRCRVTSATTSSLRRLLVSGVGVLAAVGLLASACGGGSDDSDEAGDDVGPVTIIDDDAPTSTPVVAATSTPLPTPTALPTATPAPLDEPTPGAVLLETAFTNSSKVTTVGIDEVFFGMTADEAADAASTEWVTDGSASATCYLVTPSNGPSGVTLWIVDGRVERIDIENPEIRTPSSLGVGRTLAELESQLGGRLTSEETDDGRVIATFTPSDPGDREFRLVFELVDDQVVQYRSGRIGIIERSVEDC